MTAFRSQTDEQLATRHDPTPLEWAGYRYPASMRDQLPTNAEFAPRVECIPSRDPYPWRCSGTLQSSSAFCEALRTHEWSPRPEFARPPVNPILTAFRADRPDFAESWIEAIDRPDNCIPEVRDRIDLALTDFGVEFQPERNAFEAHARKVLARLAVLS